VKWRAANWIPGRISAQIAIIITIALVVIHSILTYGFFLERAGRTPHDPPGALSPLVRLIDAAAPQVRPGLVASIRQAFPRLDIALADAAPDGSGAVPLDHLASVGGLPSGPIAIRLADGGLVTARVSAPPPLPPPLAPVSATILSLAIIMTLLGLWAARALTAPLRAFAAAAEAFRPDARIAPLPETGPHEIRTAAIALNRMRERIKRLVDDRTRMLAAVGHDLRTPITRLRLRSELIDNPLMRAQMLDDLAQMNEMIEQVLMFLREGRSQEDATVIDLATSLQMLCDQFADTGRDVTYQGPDHVTMRGHPVALHRAVTNLIDNAIRYGESALVRLTAEPGAVVIAVEDDGPGIPDGQKDAMLEPFVRGDAARRMDGHVGFGLGLSIARAVVTAHGGTLALLDRRPTGLVAKIELPAGREAAAPAITI
jgi:signal transduction histidine kinase